MSFLEGITFPGLVETGFLVFGFCSFFSVISYPCNLFTVEHITEYNN